MCIVYRLNCRYTTKLKLTKLRNILYTVHVTLLYRKVEAS